MNSYEERAWDGIKAWRSRRVSRRLGDIVPRRFREVAQGWGNTASEGLGHVPGIGYIRRALEAVLEVIIEAGAATVFRSEAVGRLRRRGAEIGHFDEVRSLSLEVCDKAFPRLDRYLYMGGSGAIGAAAAAVTTVGELFTVGGAAVSAPVGGVAGAPGVAAVIAATVTDMGTLLIMSSRLIAETGTAYGYDPADPLEKLFIAGVLGVATAGSEAAKWAAYQELSKLTQQLARNAAWKTLESYQVAAALRKIYGEFGFRLTKERLGATIPFVGIAVQGGLNARQMSRVADESWYSYRERRLREDHPDFPFDAGAGSPPADGPGEAEESAIPIVEIVEAEIDSP